ncbi:prepilin-type N-terminal cleavage/methylation domain-containing protein, partial [bacterium]|nr:prepilin-type N-terminal cleavage/methylation domain-containing protein [bacterium]
MTRRHGGRERVTDSPIPRFPDSLIYRFPASPLPRFDSSPIPRFPDSKKAGFTLIEIVIVILLIGVLGALFVPRFLRQHDSFKVEAAAEQIANHIRLTQSQAIARHPATGTKKFGI